MTKKYSVLFVCIHNSARSQMAEAFLRTLGGEYFSVESAGLEPGTLNPLVVVTMQEVGIDISEQKTTLVDELIRQGRQFDYVITVCDAANGQRCPVFPGTAKRLHWSFDDPAALPGKYTEQMQEICRIREEIYKKIIFFLQERNISCIQYNMSS
ncbi:MAG: arsenate reductase ArsC [Candidatus Electrothrix sp. AW3_4]|nr:arsenate reductase ArsC [Candidatus Electrothrix gigas]MCI5178727.1 arsenate reductase ArsC [Candidatus Electrothrix gigas]